jgi:hypothetical protein
LLAVTRQDKQKQSAPECDLHEFHGYAYSNTPDVRRLAAAC